MGLLDKTNPRATLYSVLLHATVIGFVGALLYLLAMTWKESLREHWVLGLILWTALCIFVGGLWEWQVAEDDGNDEHEFIKTEDKDAS